MNIEYYIFEHVFSKRSTSIVLLCLICSTTNKSLKFIMSLFLFANREGKTCWSCRNTVIIIIIIWLMK